MAKRRRTILPLPEGGMCLAYSLGERTERGLCSAGKFGHRRGLEISKRGSALPAFLRDKSRAPGEFSVGALNRYLARSGPASARTFVIFPWCRRAQRASAGDHAPDLNKSLNDE